MNVAGTTALITGASGFIGGRLVERLMTDGRTTVRVALRRYAGAANLARYPVDIAFVGDDDDEAWTAALDGVDVVYHCAHDWSGTETNITLAERLIRCSAAAGVRRLVYTSSLAAYFPLSGDRLNEESPWTDTPWTYAATKRATSGRLLGLGPEHGVEVVVLEPVCVYGPFSGSFTITPARELRGGRVVVPPDEEGICHLVYVDDLVEALLLAGAAPRAAGERIIVGGAEAIPWRVLYERYAQVLGTGEIVSMTTEQLDALADPSAGSGSTVRRLRRDPRWLLSSPALSSLRIAAHRVVGERLWTKARSATPLPLLLPADEDRMFRWVQYDIDSDKARRLLGYRPRVDIERGMDLTGQYLRWASL